MLSFCAVCNCSNCAAREKDKSNYRFPKKIWNFRKWEGKNGSNFQERFNWEKAAKNKSKNQNNAFCFSFISFFTWSSQHQILKANTYSVLTNGNRTWTTSVRVLNYRISKLIKSWNNPGDSSFLLNRKFSQNTHPASRVASNPNKNQLPFA